MERNWNTLAPLPLRLVLGIGFMVHGFPKLFVAAEHQGFAGTLQGLGIPYPDIMAWTVGAVEFFGGTLLILGALVTLTSLLLLVEMLVALFMVHLQQGFSFINIIGRNEAGQPVFGMPGYEVNLLYIAGLVTLIIGGAGLLSVDRIKYAPKKARARSRARVDERIQVPF